MENKGVIHGQKPAGLKISGLPAGFSGVCAPKDVEDRWVEAEKNGGGRRRRKGDPWRDNYEEMVCDLRDCRDVKSEKL